MSSIVEQVQSLSFDDLDKLVLALKRKPEKTPVERLNERVDELEEHIVKSESSLKELQTTVCFLILCSFAVLFIIRQR